MKLSRELEPLLQILVHVLEKFKEKKASVKEAVVECLSFVADYVCLHTYLKNCLL